MVEAATGKLTLVAGSTSGSGDIVDPGNATNTQLGWIAGLACGPGEISVFIADTTNNRIVRVLLNCKMAP
jgi:hypothetical protein